MRRRGHEIKIHLLQYVFTTRLLARFHYVFSGFSRSRWDFSGQNEFLPTQHRLEQFPTIWRSARRSHRPKSSSGCARGPAPPRRPRQPRSPPDAPVLVRGPGDSVLRVGPLDAVVAPGGPIPPRTATRPWLTQSTPHRSQVSAAMLPARGGARSARRGWRHSPAGGFPHFRKPAASPAPDHPGAFASRISPGRKIVLQGKFGRYRLCLGFFRSSVPTCENGRGEPPKMRRFPLAILLSIVVTVPLGCGGVAPRGCR